MELTQRFWGGAGVCAFLGLGAVLLDQPLLLVGTVTVGAWLLARQYQFIRDVGETLDELTVTQELSRPHIATNDDIRVTLEVTVDGATPVSIEAESRPPAAAVAPDNSLRMVEIDIREQDVRSCFTLEWPVSGRFEFDPPVVTMADRLGLFRRSVRYGSTPVLTVESQDAGDLQIMKGGLGIGASYGDWKSGETGVSLDLAKIREYVAGDSKRRIDWKATARLNELHVREFEERLDRSTTLVVDSRPSMREGPEGQTKLDYARHIALNWVNEWGIRRTVSLYAVGENELEVCLPPAATAEHYLRVRMSLYDLSTAIRGATVVDPETRPKRRPPDSARQVASALQTDTSRFGTMLSPLFENPRRFAHDIETEPLYSAVRRTASLADTAEVVVFSDDANRTELREAVRIARQGGNYVVVFLAPSVLFERNASTDIEAAYQRYEEFESFRRELEALDRVTVFEYGPGERLNAMVSEKRDRTRRRVNV